MSTLESHGRGGFIVHHQAVPTTMTWLTPLSVINALGPFDFDPCGLRSWPTAAVINEWPSDGLELDWSGRGRVWLNPPYGRETWTWLERLADHDGGGTALVFARTETAGFRRAVWQRADAVLFLSGRLYFHRGDGTVAKANSGAPSALVAYGSDDVERLRSCGLAGTFLSDWSVLDEHLG